MTLRETGARREATALARAEIRPAPHDRDRTPEQIEGDIRHTRQRLSTTIAALESKLAPRRLVARGTENLFDGFEGDRALFVAKLRDSALPLLLILTAAAWLILPRGQRNATGRDRAKLPAATAWRNQSAASPVDVPVPMAGQ